MGTSVSTPTSQPFSAMASDRSESIAPMHFLLVTYAGCVCVYAHASSPPVSSPPFFLLPRGGG